ncbi:MAG: glutamine--fructose-6-phosphate transaminase (isomerizing) [Gammaproteobacteria bacterium]|nr:MAG: glutamine--fructose-6-phosphate transaminase (isomerizing) [Gammaproteobacteria bacterium]
MCGIVGAVAQRNVVPLLLEGLKRLEYRGYDSSGLAVFDQDGVIRRHRETGKIAELEEGIKGNPFPLFGEVGIAHTRWATHGAPERKNAHPHLSGTRVAVVHNGIIENHADLRDQQSRRGYQFESDTDTEVIAHQIDWYLQSSDSIISALRSTVDDLRGAYAIAVMVMDDPDHLYVLKKGSPIVIGVGVGEHFVASDSNALLSMTNRFVFLEEGDLAILGREDFRILDECLVEVTRPLHESERVVKDIEKGLYRHYMLKEIFEQPSVISETLEGRLTHGKQLLANFMDDQSSAILGEIDEIRILACGSSYHAGLVAQYWFESIAKIPCRVEIASEFRYRAVCVNPRALLVAISQSGETADTIAAMESALERGFKHSLAICNVAESRLVRICDMKLLTRAGPEIGVASTKAFTSQLVALFLLVLMTARFRGMDDSTCQHWVECLEALPAAIEATLHRHDEIRLLAEHFADKHHALFLGRGNLYPIAMEGALKLKEISYIHAEAYPAGELKHGPLALVDEQMPVIAIAPNDELLGKLLANLEEVSARGGQLIVFCDSQVRIPQTGNLLQLSFTGINNDLAPVFWTVPLQLLAYYVALIKGTDIDQPRNLAKSVTVE